ncbi:MAG: hypothetical protein IKC35_04980 [Clostridia bacterium]|nr:hypothetical protein [Clostridia bacterium]
MAKKFDYITAAAKMVEKGEYESALYYYFLERKVAPSDDVDLSIANVYAAMGLNNEALKFYFRAYAACKDNEDAIKGIIFCLKDIDSNAAYYYLHCVLNENAREDVGFDYEEYDEPPPLKVHDRRDKSELMEKAYELIEKGSLDDAEKIFSSIASESYQYGDALVGKATLRMDEAKADEAQKLALEAIGVSAKHVGAHVIMIMVCDAKNDKQGMDEWARRLHQLDSKAEDDVIKTALCLCTYGYYALAEKYVLRRLEFAPYDKLMLLNLINVHMSGGSVDKAYKVANKVNVIFPEDVEVKELTTRLLKSKDCKMPSELFAFRREWAENIKNLFMTEGAFTEPEHIMWVKWLLESEEYMFLQSAVCAFITGMPEYDEILDEVLIDPLAHQMIKKQILLRRACDRRTERVEFVISNVFRSLKVEHPQVAENLEFAYYYVFVALAVMELEFEKELAQAIKKIAQRYDNANEQDRAELSLNALATHLYLLARGGKVKNVLELFDCSEEEFKKAAAVLDI